MLNTLAPLTSTKSVIVSVFEGCKVKEPPLITCNVFPNPL